jgi:hypothetical protein
MYFDPSAFVVTFAPSGKASLCPLTTAEVKHSSASMSVRAGPRSGSLPRSPPDFTGQL